MVKPISPDEAMFSKQDVIPEVVLEVVNQLLKERYNGRDSVRILRRDVLDEALARMRADGVSVTKDEFFKRHWLDFEQAYRNVGWKVDYDSPVYNESYEPSWTFTRMR